MWICVYYNKGTSFVWEKAAGIKNKEESWEILHQAYFRTVLMCNEQGFNVLCGFLKVCVSAAVCSGCMSQQVSYHLWGNREQAAGTMKIKLQERKIRSGSGSPENLPGFVLLCTYNTPTIITWIGPWRNVILCMNRYFSSLCMMMGRMTGRTRRRLKGQFRTFDTCFPGEPVCWMLLTHSTDPRGESMETPE